MAKRRINFLKSTSGFTLLELLVGVGILGVAILALNGSSSFFMKKNKNMQESAIVSNYVNSLYQSIQSNLNLYQVTYNSKSFFEATTPEALEKILPLAWDSQNIVPKSQCKICPGRIGFVIEPLNEYRGLYRLTVRVTHPKIQGYKDYVMLLVGH